MSWLLIGIFLHLLTAEPKSTTGLLFLYLTQYLGDIILRLFNVVIRIVIMVRIVCLWHLFQFGLN